MSFEQQLLYEKLEKVTQHLPNDQRIAILSQVAIGNFHLMDANAFSCVPEALRSVLGDLVSGYEGYVIGVHQGLTSLLFDVSFILFSSITVVKTRQVTSPNDDPDKVSMQNILPFDEGARKLYRAVKRSLNPTSGGIAEIPLIQDERISVAGNVALAAQTFVVAHELSHILLGHTGKPLHPPSIPTYQLPSYNASVEHCREFKADHTAMCLMLDSAIGHEDDFGMTSLVTGIEYCLFVLQMREVVAGLQKACSHPSARDRLHQLREHIGLSGHYYELSNAITPLAEEALRRAISKSA